MAQRKPGKIVLASGNAGKIREIERILDGLDMQVVPQSELGISGADETGTTFEENALIKARHAASATGLPAIADDSGLAVDALDGAPGIYSARYAGADASDSDNIDKLLRNLEGIAHRDAAFQCCACFVTPGDDEPLVAHGEWKGSILDARRGESGFGYDPVFLDPQSGLSAAQLSAEQKNARSHRGEALRKLEALLRGRYG